MELNPKISIIIPVYNGSNYLREAIDSVLKQTCHDYELIVVNDGSTDDGATEAIARSFGNRIRYYCKTNGGVSSALNLGIQHMRGEWFVWLSHDDLFSSNRVESDLRFLNHHNDARVLFCKIADIDTLGRVLNEVKYPINKVTNAKDALRLGGVNFCSMTIHYSCFKKIGQFNENNRTTQDTEMSLRLASEYPFFFNEEAISYKREHSSRGTYVLRDQHRLDRLLLCGIIHDELGIKSFFPDLTDDPGSKAEAWMWLGGLYECFGSIQYAQESYKLAEAELGFWWRWIAKLKILLLQIKSDILRKTLRLGLRALRRMFGFTLSRKKG